MWNFVSLCNYYHEKLLRKLDTLLPQFKRQFFFSSNLDICQFWTVSSWGDYQITLFKLWNSIQEYFTFGKDRIIFPCNDTVSISRIFSWPELIVVEVDRVPKKQINFDALPNPTFTLQCTVISKISWMITVVYCTYWVSFFNVWDLGNHQLLLLMSFHRSMKWDYFPTFN